MKNLKNLKYMALGLLGFFAFGMIIDGVHFTDLFGYLTAHLDHLAPFPFLAGILDMTAYDPMLKEYYDRENIENMVYPDHPLYAMVAKNEKFTGRNKPIPLVYGNPQGRSATFSKALANKTSSKTEQFLITRAKDYSLADIDGETIEASEGDAGAFMEAATVEIDGAIQAVSASIASSLYRNGAGTIGQVANSSFATTTLTLTNAEDVVNFEVGMTLTLAADETSSVRSGTLTVAGVDRAAGTITTSGNISSGVSAVAQNDYISVEGDYLSKLKGLQAWIPNSAPGATSYFGVDRSVDPTRLGGVRYDGSALSIEEAIVNGVKLANREGGKIDKMFMNYNRWGDLEISLGSKVQYTDSRSYANPEVGFRGIQVNSGRGIIDVLADQNCPDSYGFGLKMASWKLHSLGPSVKLLAGDGNKILRSASADAYEVRVGGYLQLATNAPGHNLNLQLA